MSGHGDHDDAAHGDEGHHDDDHHAPPPPEEPATPLWLTLLGIGLFLIAGILFIASRSDGKTTAQLTATSAAPEAAAAPVAAAPAPAPVPVQGNPGTVQRLNAPPNPPGSPQPAVRP
jgi:hypothetical protein